MSRKHFVRFAGVSVLAGATVLAQADAAFATGYESNHSKGKQSSHSNGSHLDSLEKKYKSSEGAYGKTSGDKKADVKSDNKNPYGKADDKKSHDSKPYEDKKHEDKKHENKKPKQDDCKPEKPKVEKPKPKPETPKVEKPKVEIPAPKVEKPVEVKPEVVVAPAAVEAPAPVPAPAPVVESMQLAETGVETVPLAALGTALLGMGIAMERASRRMRRNEASSNSKGFDWIAANTAAWPQLIG